MGKVDCIALGGLDFIFYSNDHLPHHFHVIKKGKWEMRVFFMLTSASTLYSEIVWQKERRGPSAIETSSIQELVVKHRAILLKEWDEKVKRD
jgi:hypothetical protein